MKTILLFSFSLLFINFIQAQDAQKYISEAYSLVKIKSFNANDNSKKCDVYAYLRAGNQLRKATYIIELKRKATNEIIFREAVDFNHLEKLSLVQSYRQKDDVYEFFFGLWVMHPDTYMQIIATDAQGYSITIPVEATDYKNPITIMN